MTMTAIETETVALAGTVLDCLVSRGLLLGVAESLTGGELAATFVSVPGASAAFLGGVVSYAPSVKVGVLGVSPELVATEGTVHPQVAAQMAQGVARALHADVALATTGVAGPGPAEGHPAGTVFIACALGLALGREPSGRVEVRQYQFAGSRAQIRAQSVTAALALLLEQLSE